jgi:hypothetical protein
MSLKQRYIDNLDSDFFDIHSDGSILDGDVEDEAEIVSHPATYDYLIQNKHLWRYIFESRKFGARSYATNSCGIHIHLTRDYFTKEHLHRFLTMVYNQPSFTYLISQRKYSELQRWGSLYKRDSGKPTKLNYADIKGRVDKRPYERYEAVNLTNSNTIELRLFRGTLNEVSFWKNIEYTHALVEFTKVTSFKKLTLKNFIKFIGNKKDELPNLYKWLAGRRESLKAANKGSYNKRKARRIMKHLELIN